MTQSNNLEPKGFLWLTRERKGLLQKQVGYLINDNGGSRLSEYERGLALPNLRRALKLEIVFGVPLRSLFPELYNQLREEVKGHALAAGLEDYLVDLFGDGRCFYAELLNGRPSKEELNLARAHGTKLINRIAELDPGAII